MVELRPPQNCKCLEEGQKKEGRRGARIMGLGNTEGDTLGISWDVAWLVVGPSSTLDQGWLTGLRSSFRSSSGTSKEDISPNTSNLPEALFCRQTVHSYHLQWASFRQSASHWLVSPAKVWKVKVVGINFYSATTIYEWVMLLFMPPPPCIKNWWHIFFL